MADFDLSMVASFDTQGVEAGASRVEGSIDKVANAEKRASSQTKASSAAAKEAARAERERAAAIDAVRSAIDPAYASQKRANELLAQATRLQREGAISLKQLEAAQRLHAQAMKGGAATAGQARSAYTQLGFQIQDVTQTLAMGINPFVVFGQQAGQTAAAVAGMGGKLGAVGTFLSGPFGSIILGATTVLGLLAFGHKKAGDEADKHKDKVRALDEVLRDEKSSIGEVIDALDEYNRAQKKAQATDLDSIRARARSVESRLKEAIATREQLKAELALAEARALRSGRDTPSGGAGNLAQSRAASELQQVRDAIAENNSQLPGLIESSTNVVREAADKISELQSDQEKSIRAGFEQLRNQAKASITDVGALTAKLTELRKGEDAAIKAMQAHNREREKTVRGASASSQASLGDMVALVKELFPGATITSTTGGKHARGSDHYASRAIDFVPAGGMGSLSTADVEARLKAAGVDIRRNASGTQQLFGPGRSAGRAGDHDDHFHFAWQGAAPDIDKVREAAEKAEQALADFGERSGEAIQRVNEQFDEQPKLIDSAAAATRKLDALIAELTEKKPPNFEKLIADAEAAKGVIADSLLRPFDELIEQSNRRRQIDDLIVSGREAEAEALQRIWQLEERLGPLTADRKREILATVEAEQAHAEALEKVRETQDAYLSATRSVRQEVEAILSGTGKLSNLKGIFQQLKGKVLAQQLFGDVFRDLDKYVREETGIKESVDILAGETERAGNAAGDMADALDEAVARIRGIAAPGGSSAFNEAFAGFGGAAAGAVAAAGAGGAFGGLGGLARNSDGGIVVTADRNTAGGLTPEAYFGEMTRRLVKPLLDGLDGIFGTSFFKRFEGTFAGAANGYLTGGVPGGILGALKSIKGLPEGISNALGKGLQGAQTGTMVAGIGKALGLKMSSTGAQIGGAIGNVIPGVGGVIGSIAGGLIGGLFKKAPKSSASFTGADAFSTSARGKGMSESINSLAGAFQSSLQNIASALGADLGSFGVSIGQRKDEFRVSSSSGVDAGAKKVSGLIYKGKDADAAIAAAIRDAIADGAVKGLSDAVKRALNSSTDIDKAVAEAVKVKNLEDALASVGDAFAKEMADFRKLAEERVELARKYGLDLVKVEALNAKERKALVDEALERSVGSLKRLVEDLTFGSLFEGTASERRSKLLGEVADAKEDVAAGVAGATDRLADLERQLVQTSREAFGTAGSEYAADRADALSTAQSIIEAEQKRIQDAAAATAEQIALANETNDLLAGTNGRLDTVIGNLGNLAGLLGGLGFAAGAGASVNLRQPAVQY